ncbi:biopolymer transporter ExbB [Falsirhodobacter xinxiangensis]|uniref:biopolymer transporter ExbB n=1 Tax=Falsirhodobacter xinxiangensis TaxID=2530049 RepID=UPI001FE3C1DB|nr:biopolymer transporter ExbB [Rhodobacter xinxiangensis]
MEKSFNAIRPGPLTRPDKFFTQPLRQLLLMTLVMALVIGGIVFAWDHLWPLFQAKPWLNGFIAAVFAIGVGTCFFHVIRLMQSITWIEAFVQQRGVQSEPPAMLVPLAALLRSRTNRSHISASSSRSILESVGTRLDESREIAHYLGSLLIFLGLLGTFFGLATTVPALVETIRSLSPAEGTDVTGPEVLTALMTGLQNQLGGMGTAFSSSLLGLAGSLVVGLLEIFASHGQNRFHQELEEWLSSITRIGMSGEGDVDSVGAVLAEMGEQMAATQDLFTQAEASRAESDARIDALVGAVGSLVTRIDTDKDALARIAAALEAQAAKDAPHADAEYRMRLRSIDMQLLRLLEELSSGRQESVAELRGDLAALTQALRRA